MRHLAGLLYEIFKARQCDPVPIGMEAVEGRSTEITRDQDCMGFKQIS
jgi:hypothetical protein